MRRKMRNWVEHNFGATLRAWAEPTDDGMVFEALAADGSLVRADSVPLLIAALAERQGEEARLPLVA
jgi:hypothetical protein